MIKIQDMSRKFVCRSCQRLTGHCPISGGPIEGSQKQRDNNTTLVQTFKVFRCRECGITTFCIDTHVYPGPMMGDSWIETSHYYPALPSKIKPDWYGNLSKGHKLILDEVYKAMDEDLLFLTSIGARTAIDTLIIELIGDVGSFDEKLKTLVKRGIIDEAERNALDAAIDTGSASAHRGYRPKKGQINHVMDILESIFFKLKIEPGQKKKLAEKVKSLCNATPKRITSKKD